VDITSDEVVLAFKNLNTNNACDVDGILNEYLINCKDVLVPCLVDLFNNVFMCGYFPSDLHIVSTVPTFEHSDIDDPNKYIVITLVCYIR